MIKVSSDNGLENYEKKSIVMDSEPSICSLAPTAKPQHVTRYLDHTSAHVANGLTLS